MMLSPDGPPALPLWIHGRAFLTMAPAFYEVRHAVTGAPLRRTPLCGATEVAEAARAARAALPAWQGLAAEQRAALLEAWAAGLARYAAHFAQLVREETGKVEAEASAEVEAAQAALASLACSSEDAGRVLGLAWDDRAPLATAAALLAPVLRAGGCAVLKPSPRTPGVAYALVELSGRVGLPAGVVNLVQGDTAALEALCAEPGIDRVAFSGRAELAAQVAAMAAHSGKPFAALA